MVGSSIGAGPIIPCRSSAPRVAPWARDYTKYTLNNVEWCLVTPHTKWALPVPVYTVSIITLTANNLKLFTIIYSDVIAEVIPKT